MPEEKITQEEFQRIQEDLEDLEKYIEELFTFLPLSICTINPLEIIIDANRALRNLSHYPGVEIIGKSLADIFLEKKGIENLLKEAREKEKIENKELTLVSKEKKEIPVNVSVSEKKDEKGNLTRYFLAIFDITEIKKFREGLEEKVKERTRELTQANIRLQELDHLKSMFIATMSHELRTPLNSIIGFTGIMLMGMTGDLTEEQRRQLTLVKKSANHLLELINDIIDKSKIEAGKAEVFIEQFDLPSVVQQVKESFEVAAEGKGLKTLLNMPKRLEVISDERRIKQIIVNLVDNAIKFNDKGEIRIKVAEKDGVVEVSVEDTGPGIRKEDMDLLFDAFSKIHPGGERKEGTGLGLHLSRKIADLLGGQISAESEFGKGSTFTLTFPLGYKGVKV